MNRGNTDAVVFYIMYSNFANQTTPASVTIKVTTRVRETLEAQFLTESKARVTTSAGATYEWYRI